jgi:hypothetical protein
MQDKVVSSFAVRLRDVLGTLETAAILDAAETRVRGLGEQLQFACLALPCEEAFVALEVSTLGRLSVPGVASAEDWRPGDRQLMPSGTPFAYLLGGGASFATELEEGDPLLVALGPALLSAPRFAAFVPIRVGGAVLGGAALLRSTESFGDAALAMAERLGTVLSLTVESYRTERVLLSLFARLLPDLCAADAPTDFSTALSRYIHQLRVSPVYRQRLELAETIGRVAAAGAAETRLVVDVLARVDTYLRELTGAGSDAGEGDDLLTDELYG